MAAVPSSAALASITAPAPGTSRQRREERALDLVRRPVGCSSSRRAAAPETTAARHRGAAGAEVAFAQDAAAAEALEVAPRGERRHQARARREHLGLLRTPSWVRPRLDQGASTSSSRVNVPRSSSAPAVITHGSLPGAYVTASFAALVAGGGDDHQPGEPGALDGRVERIGPVRLGDRRGQRQVHHADAERRPCGRPRTGSRRSRRGPWCRRRRRRP